MLLLLACVFFGQVVNGISEERTGRFVGGLTIVKTVVSTVTSSKPQYCYLLPTGTVPLCRRKRQWLNFQEQGYPYFRYPEQPSGIEIPYELLKSSLDAIEAESEQEPQLRSSLENEERFLPLPLPVPIPIPIKKFNLLPNIFAPMMNIQKTIPGGQAAGGGGAGSSSGLFGVGGGLSGNILGLGGGVSGGASVGVRPLGNAPGLGMRTVTVTSTAVVKGPTQTLSVACIVPGLAYDPPCPLSVDIPIDCSNLPDLEAFVKAMNLALGGEAEIEASVLGCSRRKRSEKKNGRIRVKAKGRGGGRLTPDAFKQLLSKICGDSCTIGTVNITVNTITFPDYLKPTETDHPTEPELESTETELEERKAAHEGESPTSQATQKSTKSPMTTQRVSTASLLTKTVPKTQPAETTSETTTAATTKQNAPTARLTTKAAPKTQPTTTKAEKHT